MVVNGKNPKKSPKYLCEICDYTTCSKKDFAKHNDTTKHKINENQCFSIQKSQKIPKKMYVCHCGKEYKDNSGLWRHKKVCTFEESKQDLTILISKSDISEHINQDLIHHLMRENKEIKEMILEIVKNGITTNSYNIHTNSHNKAFNLNFFLNETCKNAMNITDFVDSIKLQLTDLIEVGELGFVEGISNIIVKNLNNLDETERPIHCTDKKRETMYIKDAGEWTKEDEQKTKLKKMITRVADKNINLLPQFRQKFPDYNNSSSKISDIHDKLVIEVMETDDDKKNKVIHNISKATIIMEK